MMRKLHSVLMGMVVVLTACSSPSAAPTPSTRNLPTLAPTAVARQAPPTAAETSPPRPAPASRRDTSAVLLAAGDIAECHLPGDEETAKLLDRMEGTVAALGDTAYPIGLPRDFKSCYEPSWGRHKARTRPATGNHEYGSAGAAGYFKYFGASAGDPSAGYYSYDLGAWHIVVVNSTCKAVGGCHEGSPQEQWLKADLAAHPATCTLAYWHHPLFTSGEEHRDDVEMRPIWRTLQNAGADVVLAAHEHNYERFAPQDASGKADPVRGIRQFIVGTGGARLYRLQERAEANSEVRNADTHGLLKLTLHPAGYEWRFVPVAGKTFTDSGKASCVGPGGSRGSIVTGKVTDASTGVPIAGAVVRYDGGSRMTDANGAYTISELAAGGSESITASAGGHIARTLSVKAATGTVRRQDFALALDPVKPVFTEGFESGELSAWTSGRGLEVQSATVHRGRYAAEGMGAERHEYAKKTLPGAYKEAYARTYFNIERRTEQVNLLRLRTTEKESIAHLYVTESGELGLANDVADTDVTSSAVVGKGWHAVELRVLISGSASTTEVWLDGARVDELSTRGNFGRELIGGLQIGEVKIKGPQKVFYDDVVLHTRRIGLK